MFKAWSRSLQTAEELTGGLGESVEATGGTRGQRRHCGQRDLWQEDPELSSSPYRCLCYQEPLT